MKNVLVVAAHPDDEVLGCGATIARHVDAGDIVNVLFLSDGVTSRDESASNDGRRNAAREAATILGCDEPTFLDFPDNRLDSIPLLEVIKEIENIALRLQPSTIYTHNSGDLNVDHRVAYNATMTAFRPLPGCSVKEIYTYEVLSSTEWSPSGQNLFRPNVAVDVSDYLEKKINAMLCYSEEVRAYPHPRSIEAMKNQAKSRGVMFGFECAEVFTIERLLIN